ncbi:IclR family transcriptional regulator [Lysinibacillus telephonicus]|uniref:Glycerol operon regulatory protein n=1 Tax=Lysinibacillus telephonicus TaxID=1714840 RepID=A0A3S0KJ60_9BACI|nr:IclR family transcriptional regulator [Lysinibacillus telephonicus]RTQ92936.1 IclR family transcriptional regulator [Lysinibacillus telephonicus]
MPIIQSVARSLEILELFDENTRELSIKEISNRLDLHKSTVHSLLKTLMHYGYIAQNTTTSDYHLGWKLYERGNLVTSQLDLRAIARKHLEKLNQQTNNTVHLVQLLGNEAVYIDKINGTGTLVVQSRIGKRVQLHSSAVGKVLAAHLDEKDFNKIFSGYQFIKRTQRSIESMEEFLEEIKKVRMNHFAIDNEENEEGVICYALPIRDYTKKVTAAVSVSTPKAIFNEEIAESNKKYLKLCVDYISKELGYTECSISKRDLA